MHKTKISLLFITLITFIACNEPSVTTENRNNQKVIKTTQIVQDLQQKVEKAFTEAKALKKSHSAWYNRDEKLPLTIVTTAYIDNKLLSTKEYQAYKKLIKKIEKDITLLDSLSGKKISNKYSSIKFIDYDKSTAHQNKFNASYNHRYDDKETLTDILRPQKEKPSQELLIRLNYKELMQGNLTIEGYKTVKQKEQKRNSYYYTLRKIGYSKMSQKEKNRAIINSLMTVLQLSIPEYVSIDRTKLVKDGDIIRFIKPNSHGYYCGEIWKYETDNEISKIQKKIEMLIPSEAIKSFDITTKSAVSITPNNKYLLKENTFRILSTIDTETGKTINEFQDQSNKNFDIFISKSLISPDGKHVLLVQQNFYDKKYNTLSYWNLKNSKIISTLSLRESSDILSMTISPDGKYALSGSEDGTVKYWELSSGNVVKVLKGHKEKVTSIEISHDGKYALSGSEELRYWNLKSGKTLKILKGHTGYIRAISIGKTGNYALSGSDDGTLRYWNLKSGKIIKVLKGHRRRVESVSISPDGNYALSMGEKLIYWDLKNSKIIKKYKNINFFQRMNKVNFDSNGQYAVMVTHESMENKRMYKLALETPRIRKEREQLEKEIENIERKRVYSKQETKQIITTTNLTDKEINILYKNNYLTTNKLSQTTIKSLLITLDFSILDPIIHKSFSIYQKYTKINTKLLEKTLLLNSRKYSKDGLYFASYFSFKENGYKQIKKIENISIKVRRGSRILQKNLFHISSIKITSDGKQAIFLSSNEEYGEPERMPRYIDIKTNKIFKILDNKEKDLRSIEISSNGKYLFARGRKELVYYNLEDGNKLNILEKDQEVINSISITPNGNYGLSAGDEGLKYWNLKTKKVQNYISKSKGFISVKIIDDGKYALVNELGTIQYYNLNNGEKIKEFKIGFQLIVANLHKKYALYKYSDRFIKYWDLEKGEVTKTLKGHTKNINSIVLSPDGNYAISTSDDYTLRYWDLKTGKTIKVLKGHTRRVYTVAISPNGEYAISGSLDNTIRYWDLKLETMNKNY